MSTTYLWWVLCHFPKNNHFPNSPTDTNYQELAQTLEVKGSVLQDCPIWGARHKWDLQAAQLQIQGFPWSPFSGSVIQQNNSELRQRFTHDDIGQWSIVPEFIVKDMIQ